VYSLWFVFTLKDAIKGKGKTPLQRNRFDKEGLEL